MFSLDCDPLNRHLSAIEAQSPTLRISFPHYVCTHIVKAHTNTYMCISFDPFTAQDLPVYCRLHHETRAKTPRSPHTASQTE